jgi:hypothetical protein
MCCAVLPPEIFMDWIESLSDSDMTEDLQQDLRSVPQIPTNAGAIWGRA